jgi:peptidoglycan/LPS O-acetylase OafA/YrhL
VALVAVAAVVVVLTSGGPSGLSKHVGPQQMTTGRAPVALDRLTSLRAFAALAVFAFHLHRWGVWGPAKVAKFGFTGVGFFFVLSGFILVWATTPGTSAQTFYRRRFGRIYPSHVVTLVIAGVLPAVAVSRGFAPGVLSATLLQAWTPTNHLLYGFNGVSWSLSCEAFFYALFPIALIAMRRARRRKLASVVLAAYAVASIVVVVGVLVSQHGSAANWGITVSTNPLVRLPEFLLGMAAGVAFMDGWRPKVAMRAALGALGVIYLLAVLVHLPQTMMDAVVPLDFVAIILAAAAADISGARGWLASRPLLYAGQVSFCFYLVHELVIVNLRRHVDGAGGSIVMLLVAALAAVALHHLVELPCQRRLRPAGKPAIGSEGFTPIPSPVSPAG